MRFKKILLAASFTLIELLLVIVIIGIITGLSTPIFKNSYANLQLSETASRFYSVMRFAQASSAVERIPYRVNFDIEKTRYWLTRQSSSQSGGEFSTIKGKFGRAIAIPESVSVDFEGDGIIFYPDGSADEVIIYFSNKNDKFYTCITEGQTGYVRLLDYKLE